MGHIVSNRNLEVPAAVLEQWQQIADLLAAIIGIPAALIMRIATPDIEVLVTSQNSGSPYKPGDNETLEESGLYCETVISTGEALLVPDALADKNWRTNPDVKLGMIAYLGFPLRWPDREPFGTICVLDRARNEFTGTTQALMEQFQSIIEHHLELIDMNRALGDKNKLLSDYLAELQALRGLIPICAHCKSIRDGLGEWHAVEYYLIKHPEADFSHGICPDCAAKHY